MAAYSIKQLSILSGVKAHTIRIWEKRYNLFSPNRTNTNIRRYSDDDLKLALNVSQLQAMGYKISQIAAMNSDEVAQLVSKGNSYVAPPLIPESLLDATINMDFHKFTAKLEESITEKGFDYTYNNLIIPFQNRLGELWLSGAIMPAQEHFATNIIREKIISLTHNLPKPNRNAPKILFFLPENEYHELGLLYSAYMAREMGFASAYLGQTVPLKDVITIGSLHDIETFYTSITKSVPLTELKDMFGKLNERFPNAFIMASGIQIESYKDQLPKKIVVVSSPQQFRQMLGKILKKQESK